MLLRRQLYNAYANLKKGSAYFFINITGLAIGIAASVLLLLWVWGELSFDRFHSRVDRLYLLNASLDKDNTTVWNGVPGPLAPFAKQDIPGIEDICRIRAAGETAIGIDGKRFFATEGAYIDSGFFSMFEFALAEGDRRHPFRDRHSLVLSKSSARKFFGDEDAIGKVIRIGDGAYYTVSAVMEDMPVNSSIRYEFFMEIDAPVSYTGVRPVAQMNAEWDNFNYNTFVLLRKGANPEAVARKLAELHRAHHNTISNKGLSYLLQPLARIHLYTATGGDRGIGSVRTMESIAILILLMACINYVSLVTARATGRSREISIRKLIGAGKGDLFTQFLTEAVLLVLLAMIVSLILLALFFPFYRDLAGGGLAFSLFSLPVVTVFAAVFLVSTLAAGIYPAIYLASFEPLKALKGTFLRTGLRNGLVVIQFATSIILILSTIVIKKQLGYIRTANLGFTKENVFGFEARDIGPHYQAVKAELENSPGVLAVTAASGDIMNVGSSSDINWEGKDPSSPLFIVDQLAVDTTIFRALDLKIDQGNQDGHLAMDATHLVVNETAVREMHLADPVGSKLTFQDRTCTITGVVRDFHFQSLREKIKPCILFYNPSWGWWKIYVRTTTNNAEAAVSAARKVFMRYNPGRTFDYRFLDDAFDIMYKSDIHTGELFDCFAFIAIVISCLGLFGLVTYTAEARLKEIAIRKVLGAGWRRIAVLLVRRFVILMIVAVAVAFPVAWIAMHTWLLSFAYRTSLSWWVFAVAAAAGFFLVFATVAAKVARTTMIPPARYIRVE